MRIVKAVNGGELLSPGWKKVVLEVRLGECIHEVLGYVWFACRAYATMHLMQEGPLSTLSFDGSEVITRKYP